MCIRDRNKAIEPYEINRDLEIKNTLKKFNIELIELWDHLLIEPSQVFTGSNKPYSVYGPFYKKLKSKINLLNSKKSFKNIGDLKDLRIGPKEKKKIDRSKLFLRL